MTGYCRRCGANLEVTTHSSTSCPVHPTAEERVAELEAEVERLRAARQVEYFYTTADEKLRAEVTRLKAVVECPVFEGTLKERTDQEIAWRREHDAAYVWAEKELAEEELRLVQAEVTRLTEALREVEQIAKHWTREHCEGGRMELYNRVCEEIGDKSWSALNGAEYVAGAILSALAQHAAREEAEGG